VDALGTASRASILGWHEVERLADGRVVFVGHRIVGPDLGGPVGECSSVRPSLRRLRARLQAEISSPYLIGSSDFFWAISIASRYGSRMNGAFGTQKLSISRFAIWVLQVLFTYSYVFTIRFRASSLTSVVVRVRDLDIDARCFVQVLGGVVVPRPGRSVRSRTPSQSRPPSSIWLVELRALVEETPPCQSTQWGRARSPPSVAAASDLRGRDAG